MEEKNEKGKNIIIVVLIGIIICLVIALIFVSFKKFIVKNENITNDSNNISDKRQDEDVIENQNDNQVITSNINGMSDTISQKKSAFGSLEKYFENYAKYIPLKYDNDSNLISYSVTDLTDKDISMAVWRYIYKTKNGLSENSKLTKEEVYSYIDTYLNLENYTLKTMSISDENIFGLDESNGVYLIKADATDFSFPDFEILNVTYDLVTGNIKATGNEYSLEMGTGNKIINNKIELEIKYNDTNGAFNLVKMNVSK